MADQSADAKAVHETIKAQRAGLELRKLRGELVDRAPAEAHVRALAEHLRDAVSRFPAEHATSIAAALGTEPETVRTVLESEFRGLLERLAGVRIELGS